MLKIVYLGTPSFSADLLEKLILSNLAIVDLVVTQPDKPTGRDQALTSSPVKLIAQKYGITVFDQKELSELPELLIANNIDVGIVFSYGKIINSETLSAPKIKIGNTNKGFINIHPSLLPKYRGASPVVFPLLLDDKETGVSLMAMDELMDHGPLITQEKLTISDDDTTQSLTSKLSNLAYEMLSNILKLLTTKRDNEITIIFQNHSLATFTRCLDRNDGFILLDLLKKAVNGESIESRELPKIYKWYSSRNNQQVTINKQQLSVKIVDRMFRALSPWPGLWTIVEINGLQRRLILKQLTTNNKQLVVSRVQLEGKKEVDFETFNKVYKVF